MMPGLHEKYFQHFYFACNHSLNKYWVQIQCCIRTKRL